MTRKEIQQLLEKLNHQLKDEIEQSQSNLKNAKSVTTSIDKLFTKATRLYEKLESPRNGVEAKLTKSKSDAQKISDLVENSRTKVTEIQNQLTSVQEHISDMQVAYQEFQTLKTRIEDPDDGLEAILEATRAKQDQVVDYANKSEALNTEIQNQLTSVQEHISDMQVAYQEFQTLKTRIEDPDDGLEAILDGSQSLKDDISATNKESQTLYKEISRFKDSAAKNISSIETIKENSQEALDSIKNAKTESDTLKEKISKIFELVSQTGHANYFDKRRKRLIVASWFWLAFAAISIYVGVRLGLDHVAPLVKVDAASNGTKVAVEAIIVRATLITPLFALGLFGITNYGKDRRLAEQYAFKSVTASTIEGSVALLERSLDKVPEIIKQERIANLAIEVMHTIHTEPQELVKATKLKVNAGNKLLQVGGELNETMESLSKSIKDIAENKS